MESTIALAGFAAGCLHVLVGPDHLAAVAPFACASDESAPRPWRTGLRWGVGHSLGVAAVGLAALLFRDLLPLEALSYWSERAVGIVLVGIGTWGLFQLAGRAQPATQRGHAALSVGVLHGFAGSSHLFGVLPALAFETRLGGLTWLASFAAGTMLAMAGFSASVGGLAQRLHGSAARLLLGGSSTAAVATGLWWLLRPLPPAL